MINEEGISDKIGFVWRLKFQDDDYLHLQRYQLGRRKFWQDVARLSAYDIRKTDNFEMNLWNEYCKIKEERNKLLQELEAIRGYRKRK